MEAVEVEAFEEEAGEEGLCSLSPVADIFYIFLSLGPSRPP